ncbi:MAG TPA: DUF1707 domain-containing protein [Longimicrobiaceae bacterium]|nr:DUF1707 domain-containing protein [Longimicrobiaceae bacterium]
MTDPTPRPPVALDQARERVIQELIEQYAHDALDDRQFEDRLDRAHAALTLPELDALVADLPALRTGATPAAPPARSGEVRERQTVVAVMGGAVRKGSWVPPRQLHVFAVMGGAELDFREARFGAGVVEVMVFALMGGVEITVPPGVRVEVEGIAVMGGFDEHATAPPPSDPHAPVVRVGGFALMGGVEIQTRLPGESKKAARKRARLESRATRQLDRELRRLDRGD